MSIQSNSTFSRLDLSLSLKSLAGSLALSIWSATAVSAATVVADLSVCGPNGAKPTSCIVDFPDVTSGSNGEITVNFVHGTKDAFVTVFGGQSIVFLSAGRDPVRRTSGALIPSDAVIRNTGVEITTLEKMVGIPARNCPHCVAFTAQSDVSISSITLTYNPGSRLDLMQIFGRPSNPNVGVSRTFGIAAVPIPASLPMAIAGFGALAMLSRQKAV